MHEDIIELLGEQGFLQWIRFGSRQLHHLFDTGVALHDLLCLNAGMIELIDIFDALYPVVGMGIEM